MSRLLLSRRLLATIISVQWGLIFFVSFAQNSGLLDRVYRNSPVAVNAKALANPLVPSLRTFTLRPILQLAQFISYTIVGFFSVQKTNKELRKIFDEKFLVLVVLYSTCYVICLVFLTAQRVIEATLFCFLMNIMSWKVLLDLSFRCSEFGFSMFTKSTTLTILLILNCLSAFSAFSYVTGMSMLNGVMIHTFEIPEYSASLFTLGIIAHGIFTWGIFDIFLLSKYTTYIFMNGWTFMWAFKGIHDNLEQEKIQEQSIILFVKLIQNFVNCVVLIKFIKVFLKVVLKQT